MEKYSLLFNVRPQSAGQRALDIFSRLAGLLVLLALAAIPGGCLVSNDEFNEARLKRDEYQAELKQLHEANDVLKREISQAYDSCNAISSQLSVVAALSIHDKFTSGLGRPRPVLPPPLATTTTPTRTRTSPRATTPSETPRSGGATRPGSGGGTRPQGGQRGGTTPPPPPPPPRGGGNGVIDWGNL